MGLVKVDKNSNQLIYNTPSVKWYQGHLSWLDLHYQEIFITAKTHSEALQNLRGKTCHCCCRRRQHETFWLPGQSMWLSEKEAGMEVALFEGVEPDHLLTPLWKVLQWCVNSSLTGSYPSAAVLQSMLQKQCGHSMNIQTPLLNNSASHSTSQNFAKARFCGYPSTSGTATEVTAFSVITDYKKGVKYPLADFNITQMLQSLTLLWAETMPKKLTAHTGMDAATHAIEAYVSTLHCDYTDPLALHAIKMISRDLVASYNGDMKARASMHNAQVPGWYGILQCSVGYRSFHGTQNRCCIQRWSHCSWLRKRNVSAKSYQIQQQESRSWQTLCWNCYFSMGLGANHRCSDRSYQNMNKQLDIPTCIRDYEGGIIDEKEFLENCHRLLNWLLAMLVPGSNPREITPAQMEKLLKCCFYDEGSWISNSFW